MDKQVTERRGGVRDRRRAPRVRQCGCCRIEFAPDRRAAVAQPAQADGPAVPPQSFDISDGTAPRCPMCGLVIVADLALVASA
jgi:hypothetical protein